MKRNMLAIDTAPGPSDLRSGDENLTGSDGRLSAGWSVVLVAVLVMIVGPPPILIMSFGLFMPQFRGAFGWSMQQVAVGATLISLMLVLVAPLQGLLADRFGCRRLILISTPLFAVGLFGMSRLGSSLPLFYISCALMPIAGLGLWPLTYMKIGTSWFDRRLGIALGCLNVGNGLGGALVPLLVGAVFSHYDWRTALIVLGVINLAVAWPMAAIWLRERPAVIAASSGPAPEVVDGLSFTQAACLPVFWVVAYGFVIIGILSGGFVLHQFNILVEAGISNHDAVWLQAYLGATSIVGRLAAGWFLDRVAAGHVVAGMLVLIAVVVGAYGASLVGHMIVACVTAVGLLVGAEMNILGYLIKRYFGMRAFGRLYGVMFALFAIGGALGAQALAASRAQLHSYMPGLLLMAALCLTASVLFAGLGPYRSANPGSIRRTTP